MCDLVLSLRHLKLMVRGGEECRLMNWELLLWICCFFHHDWRWKKRQSKWEFVIIVYKLIYQVSIKPVMYKLLNPTWLCPSSKCWSWALPSALVEPNRVRITLFLSFCGFKRYETIFYADEDISRSALGHGRSSSIFTNRFLLPMKS